MRVQKAILKKTNANAKKIDQMIRSKVDDIVMDGFQKFIYGVKDFKARTQIQKQKLQLNNGDRVILDLWSR